jgi:large subunit ribosomal protein L2
MPLKQYKPTTPGRRGMTNQDFSMVTTNKPVKSLLQIKKSKAGRNNQGKITVRHRGGGHKKFLRLINFKPFEGMKAIVKEIEYDPNRSARIARIEDQKGKLHYIIAGSKTYVGQTIQVGPGSPIEPDNRLKLSDIPTGTYIHNIELQPGRGSQIVRSAGTGAQLNAKEGKYALIKLPSGEMRKVLVDCMATIGSVGNEQHQNIKWGKAGRKRNKGWRPSVRGVVMNAADHPHGGGDGGRHGTGKAPRTPWGMKTLGYKTRSRKDTNKYIVRSRHEGKRR